MDRFSTIQIKILTGYSADIDMSILELHRKSTGLEGNIFNKGEWGGKGHIVQFSKKL